MKKKLDWHDAETCSPSNRTWCYVKLLDGTITKDMQQSGEWSDKNIDKVVKWRFVKP